jgi:alanine dehydrogenase
MARKVSAARQPEPTGMALLVLSESDVAATLSMRDAIEAVERAFLDDSSGLAGFPLRTIVRSDNGLLGAMPGALRGERSGLGAKLVTVFTGNGALGKHTHNAVIALFSSATGEPVALLDGRYITEIRTAAVSALATRALARSGFERVAILGTGVQARAHLDALRTLSAPREFRIWGRDLAHARKLAAESTALGIPAIAVAGIAEACLDADVICTLTASQEAILDARHVAPGTHVNAVGSCTPRARELSAALISAARIVCDSRDGAMAEAGDILLAIRDGALPAQPEIALLGDVLSGKIAGRNNTEEITVFESLGIAIEDIACAALVFERAAARGIGVSVDFS